MRTMLKYLSAACAGALLFACAEPAGLSTPDAPRRADASYARGRQLQLAGRQDEARAAYLAALAFDAGHVNARNGLATLYAERGDYAQAIPIWQALTAKATLSSGPALAYLFGNLGYAWYLSGDYVSAQGALEKACLLDPLNHRSWQHLGDTLYRQGQTGRARQMYRQAIALRDHDFRADYAASGGASAVVAIDSAVKAVPRPDPQWASIDIRVRPDGMLELYRIPAAHPAAATPEPAPAVSDAAAGPRSMPASPPAADAVALLEIRNGNGVNGMAKAVSAQIDDPGLKLVRLSNEKGFHVGRTRVEYAAPFRARATRLAGRLGGASVVEVKDCKPSDIRLVIGHDLAHARLVLRPREEEGRALAVATAGGKAG